MAQENARTVGQAKATGDRVRNLRHERALSVRELAKKSGVSPDAVMKLEHGARAARPSTVRKVAVALGVDPAYLLDGRDAGLGQGEVALAMVLRDRAIEGGRDAAEAYRELRDSPLSLQEILDGALDVEMAEVRARRSASHLVGPDPRSKERVPKGELDAAGEISEQRAGRLVQ